MDKLQEIKNKFNKVNICFAFWVCLMPIFAVIFQPIINAKLVTQCVEFLYLYFAFLVFHLLFLQYTQVRQNLGNNIKKLVNFPNIVACIMIMWLIISSFVNGFGSLEMFQKYLAYVMIFICFRRIDKSYYKKLLYTFTGVMMVSVILSLLFPNTNAVPGFFVNQGGYSMQFANPNYSAYVVGTLMVIIIAILGSAKATLFEKIYFSFAYVLFNLWMYANGSFVPMVAVYMATFALFVITWVRTKKFAWQYCLLLFALIPNAIIIQFIPKLTQYRNTRADFITECIAAFNNLFKTKIPYLEWGVTSGIEADGRVVGADGFDRYKLLWKTITEIFSSGHCFMFGYGVGSFGEYKPHMQLFALWIDFGFVVALSYITLFVYLIIRFFKTKWAENKLPIYIAICAFFAMSWFGSMVYHYTFMFIIALYAVAFSVSQTGIEQPKVSKKTNKK